MLVKIFEMRCFLGTALGASLCFVAEVAKDTRMEFDVDGLSKSASPQLTSLLIEQVPLISDIPDDAANHSQDLTPLSHSLVRFGKLNAFLPAALTQRR